MKTIDADICDALDLMAKDCRDMACAHYSAYEEMTLRGAIAEIRRLRAEAEDRDYESGRLRKEIADWKNRFTSLNARLAAAANGRAR